MKYRIESLVIKNSDITIHGFIVGNDLEAKSVIHVLDYKKTYIPFTCDRFVRNDVSVKYFKKIHDNTYGFTLSFQYDKNKHYYLLIQIENKEYYILINRRSIAMYRALIKLRTSDLGQTIRSILKKQKPKPSYDAWRKNHISDEAELSRQRTVSFGDNAPGFSIIIPLYETPERYLKELLESIQNQSYEKFEVCLADGSRRGKDVSAIVQEYRYKDERFKYKRLAENKGIAGNTNEALSMAEGDFIVLCDHDDLLEKDALYWLAEAIQKEPECDCLYSDEDKIDENSERYFDPHFKPDYNIDLLCSVNYICHVFAVRKSLCDEYGGFRSEYDGAQDYDFILRMTEKARKTVHVPKVLYHWRTHMESTSANPESKMYAYEAGARAIREHYHRVWPEIRIDRIENGISLGIYHTYFETDENEMISVIIPNKDHTEDLDKAIRPMIEKGSWKNLEFIIVENNSTEAETFAYYEKIQKEYPQIRVVEYTGPFNYSRINNYGEKYANGKYLLLMNNDVELIEKDSLKEMVGYLQRDDVGAVGCRLLYEDDTIQHAGVVIGIGGVADHVFRGKQSENDTYFNRAMTAQDYSAVTAAVMMVKKKDYEELGGFDESFEVAFNDIDLCLRIREKGKLVVYNPYACFHHYESKSRGAEDTPEKMNRYLDERKKFIERWEQYYTNGDPYYNPNLTLKDGSCTLEA